MEKIDVLFEHFLWWEENHEQMNSCNKYDWIDELRSAFYKECIALFMKDPEEFHALCNTEAFRDQINLYGLTKYVNAILSK